VDRCVVLVDAGYLFGAAASLLTGEASRDSIRVDFPALVESITSRAATATRLPVLRVYWFDAAPDRVPLPEHRLLRALPRVTVRLGVLTQSGGRPTQKGVDAAIHAVLTDLAQRKACADVVVITGDGDLLPAVVSAKDHGVALHVWAVQAADGAFNQSEELVAEADERQVLGLDWVSATITPRAVGEERLRSREEREILAAPRSEIPAESGEPCPETDDPHLVAHLVTNGAPRPGMPTPKLIAELHKRHDHPATAVHPADSTLRWSSEQGVLERGLPMLADLTGRQQQWQDREADITSVTGEPTEVGRVYARRWSTRVTADQLADLRAAYPRIPRQLDGELLRYAARFNLLTSHDDRIVQEDRYKIRDGFWREIEERTGALPPASVPANREPVKS
jgi:uncharacterized LabA/DUF88 family protein